MIFAKFKIATNSIFVLVFLLGSLESKEKVRADEMESVVIVSDEAITFKLSYQPTASLADEDWIFLEVQNNTDKAIEVENFWVEIGCNWIDIATNKAVSSGSIAGGDVSVPKLVQPGVHRLNHDLVSISSMNLGLPPTKGVKVDANINFILILGDGRRFDASLGKPQFSFIWRYPSEKEFATMREELKRLMAEYRELDFQTFYRVSALIEVPQVRDVLTLDEYIQSLKNSGDVNFRAKILPPLFEKHADSPELVAYYRQAFKEKPEIYSDAYNPIVWNEAFLEPLVRGCETDNWRFFSALERQASKWRDQPKIVSRLSAAVMKQHPILSRPIGEIRNQDLEEWAKAVRDARAVGDQSFIAWLRPGLNDVRDASIDLGAGGIDKARVCDRSLDAILLLLDGDGWTAFEKAGIEGYNLDEKEGVYDRVIGITQARLKSRDSKKN